ncbi:hypothetical protein L1049_007404 [Liquidambar formosana]|uniref:Uncharacterized protein n=1 Tax=Liquidambar formosana TaxID=63359 RepID=A0AAP0R653_LIQFO
MQEHNFKDLYRWDTAECMEDKAFKRLMFLDGCSILGFICCIATHQTKNLGMKSNLINLVQKDLFLLENQLPYQVLQLLIKLMKDNKIPYHWENMLAEFVDWNNKFVFTWNQYRSPHGPKSPDLLHIQWTRLLGKPSRHIRSCLPALCKTSRKIHLFCGVKELTEARIKLRPNQTGYIKDVNFGLYGIFGRPTLPHMTIDRPTRPMFLNVIAYEACSNESCWFTSYICFLDLLIDRAEDVKKLRSAGMPKNRLGSDDEVAKLFDEIAAFLEPESDTYDNIRRLIRLHFCFRRKIRIVLWVLEGIRDHFKNPWTTFAVLGGSFVIFLTAVQTFFTAYPQSSLKLSSKHRLF